jgi:hypothetical protein
MFEARLEDSSLLKKLFEAVKELCKDVRFDCNENGIALQAMDRYMRPGSTLMYTFLVLMLRSSQCF